MDLSVGERKMDAVERKKRDLKDLEEEMQRGKQSISKIHHKTSHCDTNVRYRMYMSLHVPLPAWSRGGGRGREGKGGEGGED